MTQTLQINNNATKQEIYQELLPQIKRLLDGEPDLIANLANTAAALHQTFGYLWTGFYLRQNDELVLGPFQGPIACTRIPLSPVPRGVCGASAAQNKTLIVPDVNKFPGHIACSSASKSEIVVPAVINGETVFVLDIDSTALDTFDETDALYLGKIINFITENNF